MWNIHGGLDISHGVIFAKDDIVVHEDFFRVILGFGERQTTDRFIININESGSGLPPYRIFDRETKFKFTRTVVPTREGHFIDYVGFPLSELNETVL